MTFGGGAMVRSIYALARFIYERELLLFLVVASWLGLEYLALGPFSYIRIHDTSDYFIPLRLQTTRDLLKHGITYWFPYAGAGVDRLSQDVSYVHLYEIAFLVLPGWLAYQLMVFVQLFLAGYFTYRVCRDFLDVSKLGSVYAGIVYAQSYTFVNGYVYSHLGIAGFPFILWALEKVFDLRKDSSYSWLWIILLGSLYSSGSSIAYSLPFTLSMSVLWFTFVRRIGSIRFWLLFFVFCTVAVALHVPQIWSVLSNRPISHRVNWDLVMDFGAVRSGLLSLRRISVVFLVIALAGGVVTRLRNRTFNWLLGLGTFCSLGVGFVNLLMGYLGFLRGFQLDRFYELTPLFVALCGGIAISEIRGYIRYFENAETQNGYPVSCSAVVFVLGMAGVLYDSSWVKVEHAREWMVQGNYIANYLSGDLIDLAKAAEGGEDKYRVAVVAADLHPSYANAYGLETADGYVNVYPQRYIDFWSRVIEPLTGKNEQLGRYFRAGNRVYLFGYPNVPMPSKGEIVFGEYYRLNLLSLANVKYIVSPIRLIDDHLRPMREGLWWRKLSIKEKVLKSLQNNFRGRRDLYIYENKSVLPRFFFVGRVQFFGTTGELLRSMSSMDANFLRNTVLAEERYRKRLGSERLGYSLGTITVNEYGPDSIRLSVKLDGPAILVASNSFSPFWRCQVDGVEKELFPAYHAFWGTYVNEDAKDIWCHYNPPYAMFSTKR